ncbi:rust resistance kinase Lr10-like [Quercus suber]|uniref:rust resistance kinase Lr10-like n=1 Tax=Quercus suber TaxID=58331 RepID=UPI0032DF863F
MDISLRLVIPTLLLFVLFIVDLGEGHNWCPVRCGDHGPDIRPPFLLSKNRQPDQHGGFDLYCNDKDDTVLELSTSVKAFVKHIDYKSQSITVTDSDNCFPRKIQELNLSSTPFQFTNFLYNYSLFSCTPDTESSYYLIPCLSSFSTSVYAFPSERDIDDLSILSCTKMYSVSSVPFYIWRSHSFQLTWSGSECGRGEVKGKNCRFEENSSDVRTECKDKGTLTKIVITGSILGSFFFVLVVYALYRVYRYDKIEKENQARIEMFLEDYKALKPTRYSYNDVKRITNQFTEKLGQGAYGTVFKGKFSNEIHVAVKILNSSKGNGEEFINEVGTMGRIHHVNVVRLVGFCADGFRRALVYEFLPNDSLEKFISSVDSNRFLGWEKLQDIALGIAKGIEYLHQGCDQTGSL